MCCVCVGLFAFTSSDGMVGDDVRSHMGAYTLSSGLIITLVWVEWVLGALKTNWLADRSSTLLSPTFRSLSHSGHTRLETCSFCQVSAAQHNGNIFYTAWVRGVNIYTRVHGGLSCFWQWEWAVIWRGTFSMLTENNIIKTSRPGAPAGH